MDYHSLKHQDSEETLVSLLQLDPSPMDSEQDLPGMLDESSSSTRKAYGSNSNNTYSSLGLSGSGHGAIYYLTRIQRYSSYTFSVFAGLHIANTSIIPLIYRSVPYSEPFLVMAREIYQTPVAEPLLVGLPILAHVASGVALRLVRRKQNLKRYGAAVSHHPNISRRRAWAWPPLSNISASGYLFLGLLAAHVTINRAVPLLVEGDSSNVGLQFVAHGFARVSPVLPQIQGWPSYAALLYFGAGHMVWGWARWFGAAPVPMAWKDEHALPQHIRRRRRRAWWAVQSTAVAVAALWAAGGLGVVAQAGAAGGWLGGIYDSMYNWAWQ
ncbi:hypothetical protein MGN70_006942 [Eutypa lata]|nr:hypothetical protein MGN70_006942 [Eutypa lata]